MSKSKGVGRGVGGGRPTKMTPETISKLELAWSLGASDVKACHFAGISESAFFSWQSKNPKFLERKQELRAKRVMLALTSVNNGIKTDPNLALKLLEKIDPDEYGNKSTVKHEGSVNLVIYCPEEDSEKDKDK